MSPDILAEVRAAVAHHGTVLLEERIPGETLTEGAAEDRAEAIGALLGRLHATPAGKGLPPGSTTAVRQRATRELEELARARVVTGGEAQALHALLQDCDPGTTPTTVVHLDFCPVNLVRDRHGRLFSIDTEWISYGPPGADLGRMYTRWPMAVSVWRRVLCGYASSSPFAPTALVFWRVALAIWSATLRLPRSPEALARPAALLRQLAAGGAGAADDA